MSSTISGTITMSWTVDEVDLKTSHEIAQKHLAEIERPDLSPTLEAHLKEIIVCATPGNWVDLFINGESYPPVRVYFESDDSDVEIKEGFESK